MFSELNLNELNHNTIKWLIMFSASVNPIGLRWIDLGGVFSDIGVSTTYVMPCCSKYILIDHPLGSLSCCSLWFLG